LAIEAMKRKIEAKMKNQGVSSNDGLAQQIAMSIIDNTEDTPAASPTVQSPETRKESWLPERTDSTTSLPRSENSAPIAPELPMNTLKSPEHKPRKVSPSPEVVVKIEPEIETAMEDINPLRLGTANNPIILPSTPPPVNEDDMGDDDEEAALLAELEAERVAEERARQKRRELEDRLALARGRKSLRSNERDGLPQQPQQLQTVEKGEVMQDSTSSLFE
jgi:hypothetical protein